jgi:hypothetical protein
MYYIDKHFHVRRKIQQKGKQAESSRIFREHQKIQKVYLLALVYHIQISRVFWGTKSFYTVIFVCVS